MAYTLLTLQEIRVKNSRLISATLVNKIAQNKSQIVPEFLADL